MYHQLTIGALLAYVAGAVFAINVALNTGIGTPLETGMYVVAAFLFIALLFFPLIWWGHSVGFLGGMLVGILGLVDSSLGFLYVSSGDLTGDSLPAIIVSLIIAIILLFASYMAWRETA